MGYQQLIDTGEDLRTINAISDVNICKSLNKLGLVQREIQVNTKHGVITRKQWVKASEEQPTSPTKRTQLPATPYTMTDRIQHLVPWSPDEELPPHIKEMKKPIPPNWRNVRISSDPDADLLVIGKDDMNRTCYIYKESYIKAKKAEKFSRVNALMDNDEKVFDYIERLENKDVSDCLKLIYSTGIRPGSTADTKSKIQAYGASTLKGRHVVVEDNHVYLRFIGKKGVSQDHLVTDPKVAAMLIERKNNCGDDGDLFNTSSAKLRAALKPLGIKPKDLRTRLANKIASTELSKIPPVSTAKEFNAMRNAIGDLVSEQLGNTRVIALRDYIDAEVFKAWSPQGNSEWNSLKESGGEKR